MSDTILETDEKEDILDVMEQRIHEGLIRRFLKCDLVANSDSSNDEKSDFYVWAISPSPSDSISPDACGSFPVAETDPKPPDESKCMVVQAQVEMQVYFSPVRRILKLSDPLPRILEPAATTSADEQIISESGDYLEEAMRKGAFNGDDVLQTRFLGFIRDSNGHPTLNSGGEKLNVAGAEGQLMAPQKKSRVVGGVMTIAGAAICLIVLAALVLHRRKKRSDAFLTHIDGMSTFSGFGKDDCDPGTEILGDGTSSVGWFSDDFPNGMSYFDERDKNKSGALSLNRQHDVHKCTSAFCAICLKKQNPTFIASNSLNVPDILEDLRGVSCTVVDDRSSSSSIHPNTVIL